MLLFCLIFSIVISGEVKSSNEVNGDIYPRKENRETYLALAEDTEGAVEGLLSENSKIKVWIEDLLQNEDDIQYYAYMDLNTESEPMQLVILEARKRIVFRQGWVADGVTGYVTDKDGNILDVLPHFSELFPSDWDPPIMSTEVDLSYYGK